MLVLRCEADSAARLAEIRVDVEGQIKAITAQMQAKNP